MTDALRRAYSGTRPGFRSWIGLAALLLLGLWSTPAPAGPLAADDVMRMHLAQTSVVRGSGQCRPTRGSDEIVVCGRRSEDETYRLPPQARGPAPGSRAARSVSAERNALFDYDAGGIGSCSTVGPGGGTGCTLRSIRHARDD